MLAESDPALTFSESFRHSVFERVPQPEMVRAFDVSLILHAEHGFYASTLTARTVTSAGGDLHGDMAAGAALKESLRGGNAHAGGDRGARAGGSAAEWQARPRGPVLGFGHRFYEHGNSCVPMMTRYAEVMGDQLRMETGRVYAAEMLQRENIHPSLDFSAGPAYHLMGFDTPMFTPIFVASRITGGVAHVIEQMCDNRRIRLLSHYDGFAQRTAPEMSAHGVQTRRTSKTQTRGVFC